MKRPCTILGCSRPHYALGLCNMHWLRNRKHGDPHFRFFVRAASGGPRGWIRGNVNYTGKDCLTWPYARRQNGFPKMSGGSPARMMCELAHGPEPSRRHQVAHSCGKGHEGCLSPRHLRWATVSENHADKKVHGTLLRGSQIESAKLDDNRVKEARELAKTLSHSEIAALFGVSRPTMTRAINGKTWKHIA